mgnify:FL=1|jgi:hypothetical protein
MALSVLGAMLLFSCKGKGVSGESPRVPDSVGGVHDSLELSRVAGRYEGIVTAGDSTRIRTELVVDSLGGYMLTESYAGAEGAIIKDSGTAQVQTSPTLLILQSSTGGKRYYAYTDTLLTIGDAHEGLRRVAPKR